MSTQGSTALKRVLAGSERCWAGYRARSESQPCQASRIATSSPPVESAHQQPRERCSKGLVSTTSYEVLRATGTSRFHSRARGGGQSSPATLVSGTANESDSPELPARGPSLELLPTPEKPIGATRYSLEHRLGPPNPGRQTALHTVPRDATPEIGLHRLHDLGEVQRAARSRQRPRHSSLDLPVSETPSTGQPGRSARPRPLRNAVREGPEYGRHALWMV